MDKEVSFYERGAGHATFFTGDGLILSLTKKESKTDKPSFKKDVLGLKTEESEKTTTEAVTLSFVGANAKAKISSSDKMSGHVNYFVGNDKIKWQSNIPTYGTVTYNNVYKNIDIKFYGNNKNIEHDVIVRPGGDFSSVRFAYSGIKGLKISGRRRGCPRRPPTPPYVRFRIRRFMKHTEAAADDQAVTRVQMYQRSAWETPRSYARRRSSTTGHARWRPTATHGPPQVHVSSGSLHGCKGVSIVARGCSAVCAVSNRRVPRKLPSPPPTENNLPNLEEQA